MCVFVWKGWKSWRNSEKEGWMMMGKKRFERKTNEWINRLINGWINGWMDESINKWMNGWINKWINKWINEWITQLTTNDCVQQTIFYHASGFHWLIRIHTFSILGRNALSFKQSSISIRTSIHQQSPSMLPIGMFIAIFGRIPLTTIL